GPGPGGAGRRSAVDGSAQRGPAPDGGSAQPGPGRRSAAPAGPLAGGGTRLAIAARSRVAAFKTGTARRRLEHHALSSTLGLYEPGAFVPWVSYLFPPEILASYNLTPLVPEVAAATLTGTEFHSALEAAMNRLPLARDLCSYHRAAKAALESRLIPPPSVCLGTTPLCLGKECMLDAVAAEFGVPFHSVRVPLPPDEGPAPTDEVMLVADRLRELHDELGRLTGRRPRLDRAVAFSNRASVAWSELCAQRLDGSLILNGRETFAFTFIGQLVWGSEEGAKGFERLRTERGRSDLLLANAASYRGNGGAHGNGGSRGNAGPHENGGSHASGGPRPRLLWLHTMPHHDRAPFDLIAERGGAVVLEEMGQVHLVPLDPADPFPGMARRLIEHPLWGSATRRARLVLDLVRRGDVDGVVHFNHWGCRHGLGTLPVLRDSLAAAGVPFLAIDGDALDQPGHASNGAVKQLESFLEML
ncbi:MAG: 2-hydroxyacyl-CoA dehydratase, partial [Thermoleophilia bacterium]